MTIADLATERLTYVISRNVHCPACGRWLLKAAAVVSQEMHCKGCRSELRIDMAIDGDLTVTAQAC